MISRNVTFVTANDISPCNLPSESLFGVLVDPSSSRWLDGLASGGECTRETLDLRDLGADIEGRREFARLNGRPSSESLSPVVPVNKFFLDILSNKFINFYEISTHLVCSIVHNSLYCIVTLCVGWILQFRRVRMFSDMNRTLKCRVMAVLPLLHQNLLWKIDKRFLRLIFCLILLILFIFELKVQNLNLFWTSSSNFERFWT